MSLAHILLGLLQQQQRTGYDLKTDCFEGCIAHLWQADQAQIYRTLERLEAQGWATCTLEIQAERPNRKVYQITAAGQAELAHWLQTPQPAPLLREPLLMQLHFASCLADLPSAATPPQALNQHLLHLLEQERLTHQNRLATCNSLDLPPLGDPAASQEQRLHRLVLTLLQRREQTYLDWLEEALALLGAADPSG